MFWHRGAILRESSRTKGYESNTSVDRPARCMSHSPSAQDLFGLHRSRQIKYAYSLQNTNSYELVLAAAHGHIVLISQHCNSVLVNFLLEY